MNSYKPVKLAFKLYEPSSGADESLSPIIFLHGVTASKETWKDIPQNIADKTRRKAYAYDARNHGDSGYSDCFSFDLNVDDLFYFMDSENISKAVIIGHSMGGLTATYAAMKKPERFEKVFVEDMYVKKIPQAYLDAHLPLLVWRQESIQQMSSTLTESEATKFSNDYIINKIPQGSLPQERLEEIKNLKCNFKKNESGSYELNWNFKPILQSLKHSDSLISDPEGQYHGPAYFIYGSVSTLAVSSEEATIRKHFPTAKLIAVQGAGHNIHVDFEDQFVEQILNYL